jgi:hypothetical protein
MGPVSSCVHAAISMLSKLSASHSRRGVAVAFAAALTIAGGALVSAPAYAVTIDFSTDTVAGFTFTPAPPNTTNSDPQCPDPGVPRCAQIVNSGSPLTITANSGTFDLTGFLYQFSGNQGTLIVTSDKTVSLATTIMLDFLDGAQSYLVSAPAALVAAFTGITWVKFSTDNATNTRIDNVVLDGVTPTTTGTVPLPAGVALGATALGMLGFMGWRRKKNVAA